MKIVGNGRMITRDASNTFYENGAVAMDGSTIVMAGGTEEVKKAYPDAEFIDAKGGVIMPASVSYTHLDVYKRQAMTSWMPFPVKILPCIWEQTVLPIISVLQAEVSENFLMKCI